VEPAAHSRGPPSALSTPSVYNRAVLFSTPLLRAINLSIAVLALALAGCAYWFAWRPSPRRPAKSPLRFRRAAHICADALGVPTSPPLRWKTRFSCKGFVTAQDRMWQMDALRRLAAGELAEVIGRQALETDEESRRLRLGRIAEESSRPCPRPIARLSPPTPARQLYLETQRGACPSNSRFLNYQPRPWTRRGFRACRFAMYRTLTNNWRGRDQQVSHASTRRPRQGRIFCFPRAPAPKRNLARTRGRFRARAPRQAGRFLRTIRTSIWRSPHLVHGASARARPRRDRRFATRRFRR